MLDIICARVDPSADLSELEVGELPNFIGNPYQLVSNENKLYWELVSFAVVIDSQLYLNLVRMKNPYNDKNLRDTRVFAQFSLEDIIFDVCVKFIKIHKQIYIDDIIRSDY